MPGLPDQIFLSINGGLFAAALLFTIIVLILASRHVWLTGYGPQQHRVRVWMSLLLILLTLAALAGAVFNLFFV